jgi:hypothetical protein
MVNIGTERYDSSNLAHPVKSHSSASLLRFTSWIPRKFNWPGQLAEPAAVFRDNLTHGVKLNSINWNRRLLAHHPDRAGTWPPLPAQFRGSVNH